MAIAATTESISAKLRKDEKDRFSAICDEIGTSPSNAIRMFVSAFNRRGGFPFDPSNPYGFSPETLDGQEPLRPLPHRQGGHGRTRRGVGHDGAKVHGEVQEGLQAHQEAG